MRPLPAIYLSALMAHPSLAKLRATPLLRLLLSCSSPKFEHLCNSCRPLAGRSEPSPSKARMEAESSVPMYQGVPTGAVHSGSVSQVIPAAGMISSMGSLLAGFAMAPAGLFVPGRPPASAYGGYGAGAGWNGVAMAAAGQPRAAGGGNVVERAAPPAPPHRGPWTGEEDDILKAMVKQHGNRKWAVVAQALPGRIGKQCRERWTNHLRPGIKKSQWTEEDDKALIAAHKMYGNRWSVIARFLQGRSENAVKNHWNATRRSLKAKHRTKNNKKKNAQSRQLSELEEYIRAVDPPAADEPAGADTPAPPVSPPSYNMGYGEVVSPPSSAAAAAPAGYDPAAGMGMMYLNDGAGSSSGSSSNGPLMLDLNTSYYYGGDMTPPPHGMDIDYQPHQYQQPASYTDLMLGYPFMDNFMWQPSNVHHASTSANPGQYYGASPSGGGRDGGADDVDVVQMASREFLMPSPEEVTLDLTRFM
ncbi:hypothetical protein EJB05_05524, partial [Eragrostis curvula]